MAPLRLSNVNNIFKGCDRCNRSTIGGGAGANSNGLSTGANAGGKNTGNAKSGSMAAGYAIKSPPPTFKYSKTAFGTMEGQKDNKTPPIVLINVNKDSPLVSNTAGTDLYFYTQ